MLALAGRLSFNPLTGADGKPFKLVPPQPVPKVSPHDFERGQSAYVAPPADGSQVELRVNPASERIQLMQP